MIGRLDDRITLISITPTGNPCSVSDREELAEVEIPVWHDTQLGYTEVKLTLVQYSSHDPMRLRRSTPIQQILQELYRNSHEHVVASVVSG